MKKRMGRWNKGGRVPQNCWGTRQRRRRPHDGRKLREQASNRVGEWVEWRSVYGAFFRVKSKATRWEEDPAASVLQSSSSMIPLILQFLTIFFFFGMILPLHSRNVLLQLPIILKVSSISYKVKLYFIIYLKKKKKFNYFKNNHKDNCKNSITDD